MPPISKSVSKKKFDNHTKKKINLKQISFGNKIQHFLSQDS